MFIKIVCIICGLYHVFVVGIQNKNWEYTLVSIDPTFSNEEMLNVDFKIDRISRGVYGVSGVAYFTVDSDDEYVEAKAYRSASGSNNYKALPYKIQNQTLRAFMNSFYKSLLMPSLKDCSDAPQCGKDEEPVLEKNYQYKLDKCQISTDNFPSHLMAGFYKIVVTFMGAVDGSLEILVEVTTKDF